MDFIEALENWNQKYDQVTKTLCDPILTSQSHFLLDSWYLQ